MDLVISIVGFGNIGKLICALLLPKKEHRFIINIVDINPNVAGAILDLQQGNQLFSNHKIIHNSKAHFNNSDFIFHCAGASVPKDKSRLYTCHQSIEITEAIFKDFKPNKVPFIIIVANPVDIIAAITYKITGLPADHIFGTGTFLDSIRMNYYLQAEIKDAKSIDAIVHGEHGETAFLSRQLSTINGLQFEKFLDDSTIESCLNLTKNAAKEIKMTQQATMYGVSYCAINIFESLLTDKGENKPVSILLPEFLKKELGKQDIFLSLYSSINQNGVIPVEDYYPNTDEMTSLKKSVELILPCIPNRYL
tara:strand:+ start:18299 stop:19222 length:924 start_codon:yes stop_codon:yes gene_type:complete